MQRQQKIRLAAITVALVTAIALAMAGWAQGGDTPIVILDGSLTIQSAVPWSQYTGTADIRSHPHTAKSVTKVAFTVRGRDQTIAFAGESCQVDITYAGGHIVFGTGRDGKGLTMRPYSAFHAGRNANFLEHNNQNEKISHVTITKGNRQVFDSDASGGTKITISYQ
jgi:hypothetical protein